MSKSQRSSSAGIARQALLLAVTYYVVSIVNLRLTNELVGLSAFWAASGVSFAFFVACPRRSWPGLALAVFVACITGNWQAGYPWPLAVAMALANCVEPAIGAWLYCRLRPGQESQRVAILPLMAAASLACPVGAAVGGGAWWWFADASLLMTAVHWLFSDLVGILSIAPFLLVVRESPLPRMPGEAGRLEGIVIFAGQATAILASFVLFPALLQAHGAVFAVQSFLLWGGLRLRRREATALAVLNSTVILVVTASGLGPFAFLGESLDGRFIALQVFLSVSTAFYLALFDTVQRVRMSERLLARSRDELRQVLDSSADAVFIHHAETGMIVDVNERTLQMYRCRRQDIIGQHPAKFSAGEAGSNLQEGVAARLKQATLAEVPPFEWQARRLDGTRFWAEAALRFARIGEQPRVIATVRDVDRRKLLEERLRHSQKLEVIGRLTGGIVHDFRNILTALHGLVSLLKMDVPKEAPVQETMDMLESTVFKATELTEKLLAFSRKSDAAFGTISLHHCLAETIKLLERTLPKNIVVATDLKALHDSVDGDPGALPNAFLNLAINARDAMPTGGRLTISTQNRELDAAFCNRSIAPIEPSEFIEVTFTDEGHGIAPEHWEQLFQPFFTTKSEGEGTGLGLASVLACMQEHHGTVAIESAVGGGTAVRLFFPLHHGGARDAGQPR